MKVSGDYVFDPLLSSVEVESHVAVINPNEFARQDECSSWRVINDVEVVPPCILSVLCRYGMVAIPRRSVRKHAPVLGGLCCARGAVARGVGHVFQSIEEEEEVEGYRTM